MPAKPPDMPSSQSVAAPQSPVAASPKFTPLHLVSEPNLLEGLSAFDEYDKKPWNTDNIAIPDTKKDKQQGVSFAPPKDKGPAYKAGALKAIEMAESMPHPWTEKTVAQPLKFEPQENAIASLKVCVFCVCVCVCVYDMSVCRQRHFV